MKNITVSVPDEVYYAARVRAAEMRTTVSALVREQLTALAGQGSESERRSQQLRAAIDQLRQQRAGEPPFTSIENLTRDAIYDSEFRRLERAYLQRDRPPR